MSDSTQSNNKINISKINKKHGYINGLKKAGKNKPFQFLFVFDGKKHKGSTGCYDLDSAKKWLLKYKSELALNNIDLRSNVSTFLISDVLKEWTTNAKSRRLTAVYIDHVVQRINDHVISVIGDKFIRQLNNADMKNIVNTYLTSERPARWSHIKRTPSGANSLLLHVSALITYAEDQDYLVKRPKLPFVDSQEKEKKIISKSLLPEFLKTVDEEEETHLSLIVRFCLFHGLRESEARSMKWSQLDLEAGTFNIEKQKNKKFTQGIRLNELLIPLLLDLRTRAEAKTVQSVFLFPADSKDGYRSRHYLVFMLDRISVKVLGHRLSTHGLRRTFITHLSTEKEISDFKLMKLARHKNIKTTQGYVVVHEAEGQDQANEIMARLAGA